MAEGGGERSLEVTPTWAVAVICFVLVAISIIIEYLIHLLGTWLKKKHKPALYEALEKTKAELMLLGFMSLILIVIQGPISEICIPRSVGASWHPCPTDDEDAEYEDSCSEDGKVQLVSEYGIHQLHLFIFALAVSHVVYSIITLGLGTLKMRKWKAWEDETKTIEYQYSNDPDRFRFTRETSFGRRHLSFWSKSPILLWIVCFFRQFVTTVAKVDYLTLRHGFITAHFSARSETEFDFQKYINRTLEEDFKVVVGISPIIWLLTMLFLLTNTHDWYSHFWLPFIPLIVLLLVGAKLQVIITKMGLTIQARGEVVKGAPVVYPGDELFWFNRPKLILFLIHFVLFLNAFQLAFFAWSWSEFGFRSCFHQRLEDILIRISMGIIIQFLCSYVTLPLYALVTQMGSTMKPTIFSDQVATALRKWHQTAKNHTKHSRLSQNTTPFSSKPASPLHSRGMTPVHLLHNFHNEAWTADESNSPSNYGVEGSAKFRRNDKEEGDIEQQSSAQQLPASSSLHIRSETEISLTDFSFVNKE